MEARIHFGLNGEDFLRFKEWDNEHKCHLKGYSGASGGRLTFSFTPTSLGLITKVTCGCGESLDLTDYEVW